MGGLGFRVEGYVIGGDIGLYRDIAGDTLKDT